MSCLVAVLSSEYNTEVIVSESRQHTADSFFLLLFSMYLILKSMFLILIIFNPFFLNRASVVIL